MAKAIDTTISFQDKIREFCRQRLDDQPDEIALSRCFSEAAQSSFR